MCLFNCQRKNKKIIYANVYRNTINDGDSQTSPLPISPEEGGTSVHRLPFGCSLFDGGSTVNRLLFLFFNLIMAYIYAVNTEQLWLLMTGFRTAAIGQNENVSFWSRSRNGVNPAWWYVQFGSNSKFGQLWYLISKSYFYFTVVFGFWRCERAVSWTQIWQKILFFVLKITERPQNILKWPVHI